jgi:hypothetical protein
MTFGFLPSKIGLESGFEEVRFENPTPQEVLHSIFELLFFYVHKYVSGMDCCFDFSATNLLNQVLVLAWKKIQASSSMRVQ